MESIGLGKVLPGAVNDGGCTFSQGYYENRAFIVYASGPNVIILTEQLEWVQTLSSASFGYSNVRTNCVHCAALGGKIAAGWGSNVAIFQPTSMDGVGKVFPAIWELCDTLSLGGPVFSVCWKKSGSQLLVGGNSLSLWDSPIMTAKKDISSSTSGMKMIWSCRVASPIHYLKFSFDNQLFATAPLNSRQVKVWFKQKHVEVDNDDEATFKETSKELNYDFIYLNHPNTVTGFMWRKQSPLMPVGYVSNVLLTYCVDNICRLWKHQIRSRRRTRYSRLRFHIATTISPNSDIPFRSTMPVKDAPFTVHWLDNKEMAFTRKAEKVRKGYTGVLSHHPSISSLQSHEEENQNKPEAEWDYMDGFFTRSDSMSEEFDVSMKNKYYSSDWYYSLHSPLPNKPTVHIGKCSIPTKDFLRFLDDWCNSSDLLLCVHPNSGSLMIWTVEGLDSSPTCHKLAHVNFSSCLPHIFPPSDAFTLRQELLTFRHKPVLDSVIPQDTFNDTYDGLIVLNDMNGQVMLADKSSTEKIVEPTSSLSVLSCHDNGSLNLWSVELGPLPFTSVSGLIHIAHISGHHSMITNMVKHPSLPIVVTTSSVAENRDGELIVWCMGQLGAYNVKSRLTELSRISSSHPNSFSCVAWFPILCNINSNSHVPISGIFVTNVGGTLSLFDSNFFSSYSVNIKRVHSSLHSLNSFNKPHPIASTPLDISTFTGPNPLCCIGSLEGSLSSNNNGILFMHVYPAACFPFHSVEEDGQAFYVVVLENILPDGEAQVKSYHSCTGIKTVAHLWRVDMVENTVKSPKGPSQFVASYPPVGSWEKKVIYDKGTGVSGNMKDRNQNYSFHSKKILEEPLTLPHGVYIEQCRSLCDVHASNDFTSFSSFIFATSCSDGILRFWKYRSPEDANGTVQGKGSHGSWICDVIKSTGIACGIDFTISDSMFSSYSLSSLIPAAFTFANAECIAVVFYLSKPPADVPRLSASPNSQYALLTVWGCVSSAGQKWTCQTRKVLNCPAGSIKGSKPSAVLLEWIPVGNSQYVLACCFGTQLSLYSIANTKSPSVTVNDPWVLMCNGNIMQSDVRLDATLMTYIGNSTLVTSTDCEFTIITLKAISSKNLQFVIEDAKDIILRSSKDSYSIFEEAFANQSLLPEYHPLVLTDMIGAGRLDLVNTILLNVAQYMINKVTAGSTDSDTDSLDYDFDEGTSDVDTRHRLLSVSSEGMIKRSKKAKLVSIEGTIPCLRLSQCSFVPEVTAGESSTLVSESDNDLFATSSIEEYVAFADDYNETIDLSQFSPQVANKLVKLLQSNLLPGLTVVEQVCLVAIIDTVANTKLSCDDKSGHQTRGKVVGDSSGVIATLSSGAGYAVGNEIKGGGEAMDDCGLRYLLKLKNHITFQDYVPDGAKKEDLPPQDFIWAFHSDAESDLLSSIPCVQCDQPSWAGLREAGVGWWLRSNDTLRRLIEKVAKNQFTNKQEPLDASLFYLAMKKQNVLKLLFKNAGDERMTNFFKNDFTQHRWSTAALKNAFALLAKQRFEHAAAFFLLANKLWDAVEVCISRLHDPQLALVLVRLFEGDGGPTYNRFLKEHILGIQCESKAELVPHSDPFLRSIAYWLIQDYSQSLETLLVTPRNSVEAHDLDAVFNFYFFLRSHPVLLRRKFADSGGVTSKSEARKYISSVGSEKLTSFERRLLFHTAIYYLQHGCPLIALDVLTKLPDENLLLGDDLTSEGIEQTKLVVTDTKQEKSIFTPESKDNEEDIDWGQPVAKQVIEDDIDWGKPVSMQDDFDWSQPISFQAPRISDSENLDRLSAKSEEPTPSPQPVDSTKTSTSAGNNGYSDIIAYYRQLKFDTCLTILTNSLLTLSSCSTKTLQDTFQDWLHKELQEIESICWSNATQSEDDNLFKRNHELIFKLYQFVCHQSSKPSGLDHIKLELLLLLQDDMQSNEDMLDSSTEALYRQEVPNCVLQAKQIPLLTCTMLPFAHPFSLAFYLKLLIQNVVECISNCTLPISVANRQKLTSLPQLCETLSNCVSLVIGCVPNDSKLRAKHESLAAQHSNLSKWPGVPNWPNLLPSDEGRDPVHISVLLAECLLTIYLGLLAHAWSEHYITRLLYLTANCPTREMWIRVFGGALPLSKLSKRRTGSKGKSSKSQEHVDNAPKVFIPPKQTLVDAFTSKPPDSSAINYKFPKEKGVVRSSNLESLSDEDNPFCYTWSLMNTGITKIVKDAVKSILATAGMEITELPVCSPLLHLVVKTLDTWEENFQAQLESFDGAPSELSDSSPHKGQGPALLRHKSILEPENSPFRSYSDSAEIARKLWEYLIKQEDVREMFIHNLFSDKNISNSQDASSTILYKDIDGEVSTFCLNSVNPTVIVAATSREILEIDVTDILMSSDSYTITEEYCDVPGAKQSLTPNYPSTVNTENEDFLVVHPTKSPSHHNPFYSMGMDLQTGTSANMLLRRNHAGVKELEAHPTLPYYLSGSQDGAIFMWEFANAKPIVTHRHRGSGIMKIRFTQQGNKFGVADLTGHLLLWQGLHSNEKGPYQKLNCHVKTLYDFAFLSSSSFIATVGDSPDNNNLCLWDTLLPERSALVRKYTCLESGASAIAHSPALQLLVAGGKRGEICVFDIRHHVLLRTVPAHTSSINSIVLNDIEGYFVTGSSEGEIKIWDLAKLSELRSYSGEHNRSRLFRSEGGVMHLYLTNDNNLYSSGADGSLKCRTLVLES